MSSRPVLVNSHQNNHHVIIYSGHCTSPTMNSSISFNASYRINTVNNTVICVWSYHRLRESPGTAGWCTAITGNYCTIIPGACLPFTVLHGIRCQWKVWHNAQQQSMFTLVSMQWSPLLHTQPMPMYQSRYRRNTSHHCNQCPIINGVNNVTLPIRWGQSTWHQSEWIIYLSSRFTTHWSILATEMYSVIRKVTAIGFTMAPFTRNGQYLH